jgi:hypothetical protein
MPIIHHRYNSVRSFISSRPINSLHLQKIIKALLLILVTVLSSHACVVKEELDDTYKQAHIGLNQWSLKFDNSANKYYLNFELGYLIGLNDKDGIQDIDWRYQLVTVDQELLAEVSEVMREATVDRTQVFVQGARSRKLPINRPLRTNQSYVMWVVLTYNDEILKEKLFEIKAGAEGGDPTWIDEIPGGQSVIMQVGAGETIGEEDDPDLSTNNEDEVPVIEEVLSGDADEDEDIPIEVD